MLPNEFSEKRTLRNRRQHEEATYQTEMNMCGGKKKTLHNSTWIQHTFNLKIAEACSNFLLNTEFLNAKVLFCLKHSETLRQSLERGGVPFKMKQMFLRGGKHKKAFVGSDSTLTSADSRGRSKQINKHSSSPPTTEDTAYGQPKHMWSKARRSTSSLLLRFPLFWSVWGEGGVKHP